jgi:pentatricopeptide repeat protein
VIYGTGFVKSLTPDLWVVVADSDVCMRCQVDAIIRSGLKRFTDETGKLWCRLADYYVRLGQFESARDVYEEALAT